MAKAPDLYALIKSDVSARSYFKSLPSYVRDQMESRANSINSLESMRDYAENLLRADE